MCFVPIDPMCLLTPFYGNENEHDNKHKQGGSILSTGQLQHQFRLSGADFGCPGRTDNHYFEHCVRPVISGKAKGIHAMLCGMCSYGIVSI